MSLFFDERSQLMETEAVTEQKAGPLGLGMAPLVAVGGVTALCVLGLLVGGYGAVSNAVAASAPRPAAISVPPPGPQADPVPGTDDKNETDDGTGPSTAGPASPPERESAPQVIQPTDTVHFILWGDTLSQISLDTGVSVERLAEYNSIPNADLIYADEILTIPYLLIPGQDAASAPTK